MKAIVENACGSADVLGETPEAFRYLGEGHAKGKIVINVAAAADARGG